MIYRGIHDSQKSTPSGLPPPDVSPAPDPMCPMHLGWDGALRFLVVWKNNNFILQFTFSTCRCDTVIPYICNKITAMCIFSQLPCIVFSLFRRILRSMNRTSWEPNFHSVAFHITPPICCSQILAALRCAFVTLVQRDRSEFNALFGRRKNY